MPLTFTVDTTQRIIRSTGSGILTIPEVLQYFSDTRAHPDYDPTMHRVMDLRGVKQLPPSEEIRSMASFARTKAPVEPARMAIIASADFAYGVSMMFKALVGYGERLVVVRNENEALDWLLDAKHPGVTD